MTPMKAETPEACPSMAKAHVFVTGANGRIGLPLVQRLVREGHTVTGLARDASKAESVRAMGADCVVGSLSDRDVVRAALMQASHVIHLAGGLRGPKDETPDAMNRRTAEDLVKAMTGIDTIQRVVFTSSVAIYGDRSGLWVDEDSPPLPNTNYGHSKVDAEAVLREGVPEGGLSIVRLAAVYGNGFPWLMAERIRDGKGWLPGEGQNFVPTIHIEDAIEGLNRITFSKHRGTCYNLADQDPVLLRDFYAAVHQCVGGKPMRFWSTWIPSQLQHRLAFTNERWMARMGRTPRFTSDNLRLFTASVRLQVTKIADDLDMTWNHPSAPDGVRAALQS
jgi:nucleoside-diphosphate-sugar epimerase